MKNLLLPALITAAFMAAIALFAVPQTFGAHPWWASKVVWIGAPIGMILAALLALTGASYRLRGGIFGLLFVITVTAAKYGQTQFAASYAEDQLAGTLWYFGWIGAMLALAALVFSLLLRGCVFDPRSGSSPCTRATSDTEMPPNS